MIIRAKNYMGKIKDLNQNVQRAMNDLTVQKQLEEVLGGGDNE